MTIKNLIEICHTGHQGYESAADNVKNTEYATLFSGFATQRHGFENELKQCLTMMGEEPGTSVTGWVEDAAGALHRGWINIKSVVTGGSEDAILDECERGEEAAVKAYQTALETPLQQDVAQIVRQQYHSIQEAYARIKGLARVESK